MENNFMSGTSGAWWKVMEMWRCGEEEMWRRGEMGVWGNGKLGNWGNGELFNYRIFEMHCPAKLGLEIK